MPVEGYSGSPLVRKLGIKQGYICVFDNTPDHYADLLDDIPDIEVAEPGTAKDPIDFVHVFLTTNKQLESIWPHYIPKLNKTGMIWVSWPKKTSPLASEVDSNTIRQSGLHAGLVDVKVCAIDEDWSALKFMYRKEDR